MRMFRSLMLFALLGVSAAAQAEKIVPVEVGGTRIDIGVADDYLRASEQAPALFQTSAAALPPAIRLAEVLLAEGDLKRALVGQDIQQAYVQVQVMRDVEALSFTEAEWDALRPSLAQQLGAVDLNETTQALQDGMGERMGDASGGEVEIRFGEIGKPHVYSQADGVIRFVLRLPVSGRVNGKEVDLVLDCAGAALVLKGKLLMLNAYLRREGADDGFAGVRAVLDPLVDRARVLNAGPAK